MNPLPIFFESSNNTADKLPSRVSGDRGDGDSFRKTLDKQEEAIPKEKVTEASKEVEVKNDEPVSRKDGATVAADEAENGEELPDRLDIDADQVVQPVVNPAVSMVPEELSPIERGQLGLMAVLQVEGDETSGYRVADASGLQRMAPVVDDGGVEEGILPVLGTALNGADSSVPEVMSDQENRSGNLAGFINPEYGFQGGAEIKVTQAATGTSNATVLNSIAGTVEGAPGVDELLTQSTPKLMTLDQIRASLESATESVADLEIDVDPLSDARLADRFNDIQLKQNQPGLRTYTTSVDLPVSQSEWGEKVGDKIVWLANQKIQFAEIHITPPELGPLEVRINVQNDQATVTFNSQSQSVRELLEMNVNRLREMMGENGVDLANVDVSDQSRQQASKDEGNSGSDSSSEEEGVNVGQTDSTTSPIILNNLVDYYV